VSPPAPQSAPKKYVHHNVPKVWLARTPLRFFVIKSANSQGQTIQEKKPPTSQYVSQDHFLTPL
jgi:hypothetical protein